MKMHIHSRAQLKQEIDRLSLEKHQKEKKISLYIKDYAVSMKPANLVKNAFNSITNDSELKGMVKTKGAEAAIGFIVTQFLFKNSNPLIRYAATVVGTSFASNIFGKDSVKYIEKIKKLYHKFKNKKEDAGSGLFNEEDVYSG